MFLGSGFCLVLHIHVLDHNVSKVIQFLIKFIMMGKWYLHVHRCLKKRNVMQSCQWLAIFGIFLCPGLCLVFRIIAPDHSVCKVIQLWINFLKTGNWYHQFHRCLDKRNVMQS